MPSIAIGVSSVGSDQILCSAGLSMRFASLASADNDVGVLLAGVHQLREEAVGSDGRRAGGGGGDDEETSGPRARGRGPGQPSSPHSR